MKSLITILSAVSLCLASTAFARVVLETHKDGSSAGNYTVFFTEASDISGQINLNDKIVTPSGEVVKRVDDPKRGLMLQDQSGLLWTSTVMRDSPLMYPRLISEKKHVWAANEICKNIGARLPSLAEYRNLAKLFVNKNGKYESDAAAKILDPQLPAPGCRTDSEGPLDDNCLFEKYLTHINFLSDSDAYSFGAYYSNIFDLYGPGEQSRNPYLSNSDGGKAVHIPSRVKCVVSQEMIAPIDFKKKYESLAMPVMNSCNPEQFVGSWKASDVVCHDPKNDFALSTSPPGIKFGFKTGNSNLRIPGTIDKELAFIWGYRGSDTGQGYEYWFNSGEDSDGAGGKEYTAQTIKSRKDKKGCDVYEVGVSSHATHGQEYRTQKPVYLFTIGLDKDGSMVLQSNSKDVNFCFERDYDKTIEQAVRLRPMK